MKLEKSLLLLLFALLALALSGCATVPATRGDVTPGGAALAMKASDFSFDANTIAVHGTGTISLTITNTSGTAHNVTVNDPMGKAIDSVEIPPNATLTTQVTFPSTGDYYFYCNHPLHASFGMKGHFIVSGS
jgi:plastocyanin